MSGQMQPLRCRTDLQKTVLLTNFEKRGWERWGCSGALGPSAVLRDAFPCHAPVSMPPRLAHRMASRTMTSERGRPTLFLSNVAAVR